MSADVLVVCGVGGAGKTTTAAGLALAQVLAGRRVVVLTIDPARRLADALGLSSLGNVPTRVIVPDLPDGARLDALMLDRKATWDELVQAHAASPDDAARLLANPYYRGLSERLSGGHEYMATEKLHALAHDGRWDLVVVDTPPSQHALDFFRAPDRIRRLLDQRWLSALLQPGTGLTGLATRRAANLIRRLAGDAVINDLADFFSLVGETASGLRQRGAEVSALLRSEKCTFLLTTHARAPQEQEIAVFFPAIRDLGLRAAGILVNRATPPLPVPVDTLSRALVGAPLAASLSALVERRAERARRDAELVERLARTWAVPVWAIPDIPGGVDDLRLLTRIARAMPPLAPSAADPRRGF